MLRRMGGLRFRAAVVLTALALVPALLLAGLGLSAVNRLSRLARAQAGSAVAQELQSRLSSRAQEQARTIDTLFQGIASQAASLSRYVAWYYNHPENRPEPGFLRGGTDLVETSQGHRVNQPTTPVGVFVSRRTVMDAAIWREVGMLSFADPLLTAIRESTAEAERAWVISATGIARLYPNPGFGHAGSPVGPDYDLTEDEPFQAAGPERNPHRLPLWTAPYSDPATGKPMITAVAPVYDEAGRFRAVAGVDMALAGLLDRLAQRAEAGEQTLLADSEGELVTESGALAAAVRRQLAGALRGATAPGLLQLEGGQHLAYAPLPATGWALGIVAPAGALERPAAALEADIARSGRLLLAGGAAVMLLALAVAAGLAMKAASLLTRPVLQLVEGTRQLVSDLSYRLPADEPDEVGDLARAFNEMARSLAESKAEAVSQGRRVVEERNRLAREIHDTIAQGLAGIVVHLETVADYLSDRPDGGERKHLERAAQLARESLTEARRSVYNLRPSAVEESGLPAALEQLAAAARADGFETTFSVDHGARLDGLPPAAEDALYRAAQEALANVRKHSGASRVEVRLASGMGRVTLVVADDGRGFDPGEPVVQRQEGGFGLWAMRERLELTGGGLAVVSAPGRGVRVEAWVPEGGGVVGGAGDSGAGGG